MPDSDIILLVGKHGEYWRIDSLNLKIKMPEPILENRVLEKHDTGPSVQNVLLGQGFEGPRCRSGTTDMVFVHGLGTGDRLLSGDDGMKVTDLLERQRFLLCVYLRQR